MNALNFFPFSGQNWSVYLASFVLILSINITKSQSLWTIQENKMLNTDTSKLIFKSDSDFKQIYLLGEYHGVASNSKIEFFFINHLVKDYCVRSILFEGSVSDEYLINNYFYHGDSSFLDLLASEYPYNYSEYIEFIKKVKLLYDSLQESCRFKFIGVDIIENESGVYVKNLFQLMLKYDIYNKELKSKIEVCLKDSVTDLENFRAIFLDYLINVDYNSAVIAVINSIMYWKENKNQVYKNRQYYLYKNILNRRESFLGNLYGNFGYGHIDLKQKCTAFMLNNDTSFNYKITSYYPYYHNCMSLPWIPIRRNQGYGKSHFRRLFKKTKPSNGIYYSEFNGQKFIIHVGQIGMSELK